MFQIFQHLWKGLKNFFLLNYCRATKKFDYPNCILPKSKYQCLLNIDHILNKQDLYILRRSNKLEEETFNDLGILRDDTINDKELPGLSMNLLGGFFKIDYIKYVPKMGTKAVQVWKGEKVYLYEFVNDYDIRNIY